MKPLSILLVLACAAIAMSCTSLAHQQASEGNAPSTRPSLRCGMVQVSSLPVDVTVLYRLQNDALPAPILFSVVGHTASGICEVYPQIQRKVEGGWEVADLKQRDKDGLLNQCGWQYVGYCAPRHEIWAVLDCIVEDRGWDLYLIRSKDGGTTWDLAAVIHKIHYTQGLSRFTMTADGHGTLSLSDGCEDTGLYIFRTTDGGNTWQPPVLIPDDMQPADPLAGDPS